jgi:hypothetical protein
LTCMHEFDSDLCFGLNQIFFAGGPLKTRSGFVSLSHELNHFKIWASFNSFFNLFHSTCR